MTMIIAVYFYYFNVYFAMIYAVRCMLPPQLSENIAENCEAGCLILVRGPYRFTLDFVEVLPWEEVVASLI